MDEGNGGRPGKGWLDADNRAAMGVLGAALHLGLVRPRAALLVLQLPHHLAALLRGDPEAAGSIAGYVLIVAALRWTYRPLWPAARSTDGPEGTGPAAGAAADRGARAGEAGGDETSPPAC